MPTSELGAPLGSLEGERDAIRARSTCSSSASEPMIELRDISKSYRTTHGRKVVVDHLSLTLPAGAKVGVLGRNGAGKSTLLGMIAGTVRPDSGTIRRHGQISWPLGFRGSTHPELTGAQNVRFAARIYGMDTDALLAYVPGLRPARRVHRHAGARLFLGHEGAARLRHVDGHRLRLVLVDEITAVGDTAFKKKSLAAFKSRLKDAALLMTSHSTETIRSYCSRAW